MRVASTAVSLGLWLSLVPAAAAGAPVGASGGGARLTFDRAVKFYFETDIAQIHAYDGVSLGTLDLFAPDAPPQPQVKLPGIEQQAHVAHLSTTPYILVAAADARLLVGDAAAQREKSAYLVNTLTGELVWEREPLPPVNDVYVFPHDGVAVLRHGGRQDEFTAIDFRTGERLWHHEIDSRAVWADGARLEIVGGETCTIEARSGRKLRSTALPIKKKTIAVADPETRRFVFAKKSSLVGYLLPAVDALNNAPVQRWEAEGVTVSDPCVDMGFCTLELLAGGRLYESNVAQGVLIDYETGKTVWTHKRKRTAAPGMPVSGGGSYGAYVLNKRVSVIDVATGQDVREIPIEEREGKALNAEIIWIDDTDGLVVYQDKQRRPRSVVRFAATAPRPKWTTVLPEPADFKATGAEKGKLFARILASIALTAVSAANPVAVGGGYSYHFVFYPSWRVKTNQRIDPASVAGLEGSVTEEERVALQRFKRRAELVGRPEESDLLFVAGGGEAFDIRALSLADGALKTIATHRGQHIHAVEPDAEYCVAVTLEDQKRVFRVLPLPGCGAGRLAPGRGSAVPQGSHVP